VNRFNRILALACVVLGFSGATASAITVGFMGSFWDTGTFDHLPAENRLDAAIAYADRTAATATFLSTAIDYPRNAQNTVRFDRRRNPVDLADFLADDAASLSGAGSSGLSGSVFRFSGQILLTEARSRLTVGADDGFRLFINGVNVSSKTTAGGRFNTNVRTNETGVVDFVLYYVENTGNRAGIEFMVNRQVVDSSMAVVPLPASGLLLLGGLGAIALARRRRA
jgi:hypothetical protein